jgi:D-arabinose 1-dehydrogenase-like Zn-dependent alcohol dehydrogenase
MRGASLPMPKGWAETKRDSYWSDFLDPTGQVRLRANVTAGLTGAGTDQSAPDAARAELDRLRSAEGFRLISRRRCTRRRRPVPAPSRSSTSSAATGRGWTSAGASYQAGTVRALLYEQFHGPVVVAEVADPQVPDGGVLVRVAASGLCRSDWHAWAGHDDTVSVPQVPGHEFVGVIERVGPGVRTWRAGDRVTAPFVNGCGACDHCRVGDAQVCPRQTQPGFTHWGSHAEFVVVRAADLNLVAVPATISDSAAVSLGCRFATAYRGVATRGRAAPGEWVTVFGAGGVGLSAIMVAAALGARPIAVDQSRAALDLAAKVGAEHTILASADTLAELAEHTGGGAHLSIDAVGKPQTIAMSIETLRRRGRHVQLGLMTEPAPPIPLDRVLAWELDLLGSHGMPAVAYPALLDLVEQGTLRPGELVTRTVDLETAAQVMTATEPHPGITITRP